jgi:predicted phage baseplate assembly protein
VSDPAASDPKPTPPTSVTIIGFDPPLERPCTPWAGQKLVLHGNLAPARFGARRRSEIELEARACAERQDFVVEERSGRPPRLRALRAPLGPVVHRAHEEDDGIVSSVPLLSMTVEGEPWTRVPHLHGSQAYDRHYVATADEDGTLWIELGDGIRGQAIELSTASAPTVRMLVLDYHVGDVVAGNCGAGILRRFVPEPANLAGLIDFKLLPTLFNVLPGVGGRQAETKDAARLRLPASLRHGHLQRAVTLEDYAAVARSVPGVARAVAKDIGGPYNAVLVLCDPEGRSELSPTVARAVHERIDAVRMAGREHFVRAPTYVPIEVVLSVCNEPGSLAHRVRNAVLAALLPGDEDARGFFHPDELSFGEDLELADVLATVQRIPGVRSVKARRFRRADVVGEPLVRPRIRLGPTEVARMDGDPRIPEHGRLIVHVDGIDPELDDPSSHAPYLVEDSP